MSKEKRAKKRWKREHRPQKNDGSWLCSCGQRHKRNQRCPMPKFPYTGQQDVGWW